jgi:transcription initiation factor TFIID subunit 5
VFVHSILNLVGDFYPVFAQSFFNKFHERFEREHEDELRQLSTLRLPEHLESSHIAQIFRSHKYRLTFTKMAYSVLIQFLEGKDDDGGDVITKLINAHINVIEVDRAAAGNERSLAAMLARRGEEWDHPAEDEGIPGHNPGSANTDPNAPNVLPKLALGLRSMDDDLMDDVRAGLEEEDAKAPPGSGEQALVDVFEQKIKREPTEDAPGRDQVPLPPPLARDVAMEIQKVREHRDRFKIDPRSGGVVPGISVCMYTFHNTYDRYVYQTHGREQS